VSVARLAGTASNEPNVLDMDYALSGSLQDVERFGTRQLQFPRDADPNQPPVPVAMNITMNDDGGGGYRILLKGQDDQPPAMAPYDPSATKVLDSARQHLLYCFGIRDAEGQVVRDREGSLVLGINPNNGKLIFDVREGQVVVVYYDELHFHADWWRSISRVIQWWLERVGFREITDGQPTFPGSGKSSRPIGGGCTRKRA
jgi:hypothetical protein